MITVHWERAGVAPEGVVRATGRLLDLLAKLIARNERATAWLWVQESGDRKGAHVHILAHVPAHLAKRVGRAP